MQCIYSTHQDWSVVLIMLTDDDRRVTLDAEELLYLHATQRTFIRMQETSGRLKQSAAKEVMRTVRGEL